MSSKEQNKVNYSNYFIITEILFIILPVIVLFLIEASKGKYLAVFDKADISFCGVLFSGQLIIKLVAALLKRKENVHWQFVVFEIALIICLGLIPSLLFYIFMQELEPKLWIKIAQSIWLILLIWVYFELGGYAQEKEDGEK